MLDHDSSQGQLQGGHFLIVLLLLLLLLLLGAGGRGGDHEGGRGGPGVVRAVRHSPRGVGLTAGRLDLGLQFGLLELELIELPLLEGDELLLDVLGTVVLQTGLDLLADVGDDWCCPVTMLVSIKYVNCRE